MFHAFRFCARMSHSRVHSPTQNEFVSKQTECSHLSVQWCQCFTIKFLIWRKKSVLSVKNCSARRWKSFSWTIKRTFSALTDLNHKRGIKNSKHFCFGIFRAINKNVAKNSCLKNNLLVNSHANLISWKIANCCKLYCAISVYKGKGEWLLKNKESGKKKIRCPAIALAKWFFYNSFKRIWVLYVGLKRDNLLYKFHKFRQFQILFPWL